MSQDETSGGVDFGSRRVPEEEKASLVRAVFDSVAPRYDLMNDLMSGGIHRWWKAEMVAWLKPRPGQLLLDVAGGTGDVALHALPRLAPPEAATPGSILVCDASEGMLEVGRARALDQAILAGIEWVCADAERLPVADRSIDLYTIAFGLRNVTRIDAALAEARRALKPGGRFLCLEFTPEITPAAAAVIRSVQLPVRAAARLDGHRRSRGLPLSRGKHSAFPSAKRALRDDRARWARSGEVSQPHGGRRCAPFGMASLIRSDRGSGCCRAPVTLLGLSGSA